ncbi:MAG TPA: L,D-transpeptidase [Dissulfurispiraceae bacterium]|nr:L,D-transpeptidase [Dissulfurispiraceae bacterium]
MSNIYLKGIFLLFVVSFVLMSLQPNVYAKTVPSLCRIKHPSDEKVETECRRLKKGETLESLFGDRWTDVARFNRIDRRHIYTGVYIKVPGNLEDIANFTPMPQHYQPAEDDAKFILVDLSEQFLGAYEYGRLVFSAPVATGDGENETPTGEFRISAADSHHMSSLYFIEKTEKLYPMHYALRFHVDREGVAFWIHGRDVPGYPASHGCIGLYDEEMQKEYYGSPKKPLLEDAKALFDWVISPNTDDGRYHIVQDGPRLVITGQAPGIGPRKSSSPK